MMSESPQRDADCDKTWSQFAQQTTIHGIPDMITASSCWEKLMWITLLFSAIGKCTPPLLCALSNGPTLRPAH